MKKLLKIIGVVVLIGVVIIGGRWWYYVNEYRQHLPTRDISVAGVDRQYHIYVPETLGDKPAEVLVLLQGGSAGSWRIAQQFRWEELAAERGMILAVPIGMIFFDNEGAWQLNTDAGAMQDIQYVTAMLDDVAAVHDVDASRLYAVGYYPRPQSFMTMTQNILGLESIGVHYYLLAAGVLDFVLSIGIFVTKNKALRVILWYGVFWGALTSFARIFGNFYADFPLESLHQWVFECVYRFPHFLIPLVLILILKKADK